MSTSPKSKADFRQIVGDARPTTTSSPDGSPMVFPSFCCRIGSPTGTDSSYAGTSMAAPPDLAPENQYGQGSVLSGSTARSSNTWSEHMAKSKWQRKQIRASLLEIVEMFNATYGPPDPKVVDAINMSASKVKKGGNAIRVAGRKKVADK